MLIEHHREKLVNAILYFLKNTRNCGKTKLLKLLYYLDFFHFRETGKSVTGLDYYAWDFGPVPQELYNELSDARPDLREAVFVPKTNDRSFVALRAKKPFNKKYFSKRELRLLEEVACIFRDADTDAIVEASHLPNHPWEKTLQTEGRLAKIDYTLALDATSGRSLSPEEVQERINDREAIKRALGG